MKVWVKTKEHSEGKFLVVRRDGTVPHWPHFVLGARDPAAPTALRAYADHARAFGWDEAYWKSVFELAEDFEAYRRLQGAGDPDAGPHRKDDPNVIAAMRGRNAVIGVVPDIGADVAGGLPSPLQTLAASIPDIVKNAMLVAWNEICADTDCHPLDIEQDKIRNDSRIGQAQSTRGGGRFLTFEPRHWAQMAGDIVKAQIEKLLTNDAKEVVPDHERRSTPAAGGTPGTNKTG